jgi:hypothetical protein
LHRLAWRLVHVLTHPRAATFCAPLGGVRPAVEIGAARCHTMPFVATPCQGVPPNISLHIQNQFEDTSWHASSSLVGASSTTAADGILDGERMLMSFGTSGPFLSFSS